ncbi:hypothetical protein BDQ12DRAFT_729794 [Crucibulum laeve]|uniref:Uncharacterized protein n=1 Tax=Crucibulum laeve TaxID=68775 RepID=A0A5C3LR44_9AGAR|nr:hypothetical protein BDQ12DRAFT_729794 [Crucibulum laeve]
MPIITMLNNNNIDHPPTKLLNCQPLGIDHHPASNNHLSVNPSTLASPAMVLLLVFNINNDLPTLPDPSTSFSTSMKTRPPQHLVFSISEDLPIPSSSFSVSTMAHPLPPPHFNINNDPPILPPHFHINNDLPIPIPTTSFPCQQ